MRLYYKKGTLIYMDNNPGDEASLHHLRPTDTPLKCSQNQQKVWPLVKGKTLDFMQHLLNISTFGYNYKVQPKKYKDTLSCDVLATPIFFNTTLKSVDFSVLLVTLQNCCLLIGHLAQQFKNFAFYISYIETLINCNFISYLEQRL